MRPCYDLNALISLVHDPRHPYYRLLTVEHYGNVVDGKRQRIEYVNVPMEVMKRCTIGMVDGDRPCWFACDIGWHYYPKYGSLDGDQFDYKGLLGVGPIDMTKGERLEYGASINSHAMVIVGYDERESGQVLVGDGKDIVRWRVENSWGDKKGNKGYVMMTDEWFHQFAYQVVVEKRMLSQDILKVLEMEPIVLPRWDPFAQ